MGASRQFMEHRWGTRVKLDVPVALRTANGLANSWVRNASVSGAFVETNEKIPVHARVSVQLIARAGESLDALVVRVENTGVGLEWLDPGLRSVSALLSFRHDA